MGWFFGCKLHLLMNSEGEFFKMILSNGHLADIKKIEELVGGLSAVIYGDRGYLGHPLKI